MSEREATTAKRPVRMPPATADQRAELEAERERDEDDNPTGVEAVRAALAEARSALDDAEAALDELEPEQQ